MLLDKRENVKMINLIQIKQTTRIMKITAKNIMFNHNSNNKITTKGKLKLKNKPNQDVKLSRIRYYHHHHYVN